MFASISIELEPSLIEFGKSGLDISCVVYDTNLIGITNIQLMRSESYVVSVTKFKIAWQDQALENKTGVTVNASINITNTSYLRLKISRSAVRYPEDAGSYQCIFMAVTASGEIKRYQSQSIVLNITGNQTQTIIGYCCQAFLIIISIAHHCILAHYKFQNLNVNFIICLCRIKGFLESTTTLLSTSNHKSTEVSAQKGMLLVL